MLINVKPGFKRVFVKSLYGVTWPKWAEWPLKKMLQSDYIKESLQTIGELHMRAQQLSF